MFAIASILHNVKNSRCAISATRYHQIGHPPNIAQFDAHRPSKSAPSWNSAPNMRANSWAGRRPLSSRGNQRYMAMRLLLHAPDILAPTQRTLYATPTQRQRDTNPSHQMAQTWRLNSVENGGAPAGISRIRTRIHSESSTSSICRNPSTRNRHTQQ